MGESAVAPPPHLKETSTVLRDLEFGIVLRTSQPPTRGGGRWEGGRRSTLCTAECSSQQAGKWSRVRCPAPGPPGRWPGPPGIIRVAHIIVI